jgi:hypothetical protein
MAGSQDDESTDKPEKDDGRQCGKNITGHVYRCAVCLQKCPPLMPDNRTDIPVCLSCWKQISASNKLMVVSFFRSEASMARISCAIRDLIGAKPITGKSQFDGN